MSRNDLVPVAPTPKKNGRPTLYSEEMALEICRRIASGETLIEICRDEHMAHETTVRGWVLEDEMGLAEKKGSPWFGFAALYARARLMQIEHEVEEIKLITDNPVAGEITSIKYISDKEGNPIEVREVRREDMLGHRRLQVDTRKWRAGKIAAHRYGERLAALESRDGLTPPVIEGGLPDDEP